MKPEAQQIAIAKACGFIEPHIWDGQLVAGNPKERETTFVPDYLSDLNAMHEAEKVIPEELIHVYAENLGEVVNKLRPLTTTGKTNWWWMFKYTRATAAQRAEAFLRTIGKWKES